ncbi:MAG: DUF1080 domain-containing protein [Firmicutes bacterium]|nr:DUF1080 domain-containing protein [Bacillota bacterium]
MKRIFKWNLICAMILLILGFTATSANAAYSGYYQLRNAGRTTMFIDGMGRADNGSDLSQWANTTHYNSHWEFIRVSGNYYQLKNRSTGLFIDGMRRTSSGSVCGQWANTTHYNAQWEVIPDGNNIRLRNRATGLYLDGNGSTTNGANLLQRSGSSSANQRWTMISIGGATPTPAPTPTPTKPATATPTPTSGQSALFSDNFESGNYNNWTTSSGTWSVVADGSRTLRQSNTSANCYAYAGSSWTNYSVQAKLKVLSYNGSNRMAGLMARFQDTNNFYFLRFSNSNQLEIRKKVNGSTTSLASKSYTCSAGSWYTLRLDVNGNTLIAYVNGVQQLTATDSTFASGRIGVTFNYASGQIDDVVVTALSGGAPTPTPTPRPTATPVTNGSIYYVSPSGTSSNPGTINQPTTLTSAIGKVVPGDTIYMRGGTYYFSSKITIDSGRSGTASKPITLIAYPGETPILDFSAQAEQAGNDGIRLDANYWRLIGLTLRKAGGNGFRVHGSYNVLERLVAYENRLTGIHLEGPAAHNLVKNCDSYRNFNLRGRVGNKADGFACKEAVGPGNQFVGCRAWENSDDGFDLWRAPNTVRIENCWSFGNGNPAVFGNPANYEGAGNGFKLGGDYIAGNHVVIRCLAFDNKGKGFDHNNNTGALTLRHNTAYNNDRNFVFPNNPQNGGQYVFQNNCSAVSNVIAQTPSGALLQGNSWQIGTVTANMFYSVDTSLAKNPRQADGSLPIINLLRPKPGTFLIDGGVNIGEPYNGSAPDIGAFEY